MCSDLSDISRDNYWLTEVENQYVLLEHWFKEQYPEVEFSYIKNYNEEMKRTEFTVSFKVPGIVYKGSFTYVTDTMLKDEECMEALAKGVLEPMKRAIKEAIPMNPYHSEKYIR